MEMGLHQIHCFIPPRESSQSPVWICFGVKFEDKNVKICSRLAVPSCGKFTEIDFPQIPDSCLGSGSTACVCSFIPGFFLGERGIFIGAIMHISPIESADIVSLPVTCKGRGLSLRHSKTFKNAPFSF